MEMELTDNTIVKEYLKKVLLLINNPKQRAYYEWLIENGKSFTRQVDTPQVIKILKANKRFRKVKECYYNSQMIITSNKNIEYFEGYYITEFNLPIEHAWNVYEGELFDATAYWNKISVREYFGVSIPIIYVFRKILESGMSENFLERYFYDEIYQEEVDKNAN